jgi:hypothetical protein
MKTTIIISMCAITAYSFAWCMEQSHHEFHMIQLCKAIEEDNCAGAKRIVFACPQIINQYSEHGPTPLCIALCDTKVTIPHFDIARMLIDNGARINGICDEKSDRKETLLHKAAGRMAYYVDLVKLLLQYGADKKAKDTFGKTPLDWAIKMHGRCDELLDLLR